MAQNTLFQNPQNHCGVVKDTVMFDQVEGEGFVFAGETQNTGLIAYCLQHKVREGLSSCNEVERLKRAIEAQAMLDDSGKAWWRWERYPSRPDYLYPIDWDDQLKSMDALRASSEYCGVSLSIHLPDKQTLANRIKECFYQEKTIGEDNILIGPPKWAIFMFDRGFSEKMGNKEDIFVSAVVMDSGFDHGVFERSEEISYAFERLWVAAELGLKCGYPFHTLSRCYISWAHYLYLLEKINRKYQFGQAFEELRELYQSYIWQRRLCQLEIANWRMDHFFATKIGVQYSADQQKDLASAYSAPISIIYRHRRLKNFFGSREWEKVLAAG